MQKSVALLLVALILLLTACGERPVVPEETTAPPSEAASETVGGTDKHVILPNGPLPQSAYAPPSPPPRLFEEITHTLTPREDYGRIWPYAGGYVAALWMHGTLLGLCDEEGRIICDPVYNSAEIIEKDGKRLYKLTEYRRNPAGEDVSRFTLAKLDGSWAKEYEGVAYEFQGWEYFEWSAVQWRPGFMYDAISVCENGRWGVIDYEGKEVLPCTYNNPVCFSEGLAAILSDDGETYTYIDRHGNKVLGPYKTPPLQQLNLPFPIDDPLISDVKSQTLRPYYSLFFSEGVARFYDSGKYGAIDKSGRIVITPRYDFLSIFSHGTAMIVSGNIDLIERGVIDRSGRVIMEPDDAWLYQGPDGSIVLDTPQGLMTVDPETGVQTPRVNKDTSTGASYSQGSDGVVIYWDDRPPQSFPEASNVTFLDNGNFALSDRDSGTWSIVSRDGAAVAGSFDGRAEYFRNGYLYVSAGISALRDGTDTTNYTLYDRGGDRVLPDVYREIIPLDGRFLVRQDACAGLLDEQGSWVIKTPIYDYLND